MGQVHWDMIKMNIETTIIKKYCIRKLYMVYYKENENRFQIQNLINRFSSVFNKASIVQNDS